MAAKLYTEDIDKTIDWGGDEKTGGLPVSGEKVQKFIKETLDKKYGYMYFDRAANQYLVFSDEADYIEYSKDPVKNVALKLFAFDAPAPATIIISNTSKQVNTILLQEVKDQKLSFNYLVRDSSNAIKPSRMSIVISVNNNISGVKTVPTQTLDMVLDATEVGISYEYKDLGNYLSEGTNTITVTVTALEYNVSTTITYQYKVLNLMLTSTFADNGSNFYYYNGISMTDNEYFGTTLTASGTGAKYLRVFIDGKNIYGGNPNDAQYDVNASQYIGSNSPQSFDLNLQFKDANGEYKYWATAGKHSLQFYFFVLNENSEEIKSQTLYYDIVLTEAGMRRGSYILFTRTLDQGELVAEGDVLELSSIQYEGISVDYAIYDTSGRGNNEDGSAVIVELSLIKKQIGTEDTVVMSTQAAVPSATTTRFNYTFDTYGDIVLQIKNTVDGGETINVKVDVEESPIKIAAYDTNMVLELKAINRSNTEPADKRSVWEYTYTPVGTTISTSYKAVFNNVLWNNQNGWIDDCLVLNNGATVTIPVNIFAQWNSGLTFEIDFETSNVQDDDAFIMHYGSDNGAHIFINACNAELQSNNKVNIHTNYKENSHQKIQFIFNGNSFNTNEDAMKVESPYLMYIVNNGILDRCSQFSSSDSLGQNTPDSFTIGNLDGKATIKIHAIRIYREALTLDACVNNHIADSSDIRQKYLFNDVYVEGGKTIDVNKLLNADIHVPVMTIYGDITNSIVSRFDKKANVPVDILYQDPENPEFNYFARDAWMSNQGTSSMNYPRRNFRLYFNKEADSKTIRGFASNDRYDYKTRVWYGLTDSTVINQIQLGEIDLDTPITINNVTYTCFTNKKTLKKKPANIKNNFELAIWYVHSGITLYSDSACKSKIKNLNKYHNENPEGDIYVKGAYARYKSKDLYTDRWTLKCDYAESSMCHNAGVGRLWGDVLRGFDVGSEGFSYDTEGKRFATSKPGMTNAQRAAQSYVDAHANDNNGEGRLFGDIRTSCDGRPIVIVNRPRIKDENGQYTERYGDPIFLGLYNIMTDKGSTPLFGFEDLKDEDGNTIYSAGNDFGVQRTECWECLQNGSELAQMSNIKTDDEDGSLAKYTTEYDADGEYIKDTGNDNEDRLIFKTYEARWPDNDDLNNTLTNKLESVIRFVNFCQPAVSVKVGTGENVKDGYTLSDFTQISPSIAAELAALVDTPEKAINVIPSLTNWNGKLYIGVPATDYKDTTSKFYKLDAQGEVQYNDDETIMFLDPNVEEEYKKILEVINKEKILYKQSYDAQNVTGQSFAPLWREQDNYTDQQKVNAVVQQLKSATVQVFKAVEDKSEIEQVEQTYYADSGYDWYIFDNTYDRSVVTKTVITDTLKDDIYIGQVYTYDGKRRNNEGEQLWPDAWVSVYLTKNGNNYTYTDEMGNAGTRYASGQDIIVEQYKGKTLFEYFKDKKYEHFDVWKLAAYYVYIMRFAAVDQVIKNTMMTTEDGQHYYFINYDNDTVMGVRNDGYLAYDWQVTRETYDYSVGSYAYAGFGSSLWNLLEQDDDFMAKVQKAATAMVTSNVLTYDIALDMFNNKQAGTWSERLYNNSEMYKYIGTFNDLDNRGTSAYNPYQNTKYLPFLQGSRASHRDWWLRHRFDLYDSKWSAGEYATNALEFYMGLNASTSNPKNFLRIVPGSRFYYTIQSNNVTLGNNFVELAPEFDDQGNDVSYYFKTTETLILGNPMKMLGAYKVKVLDFSEYRDSLGSSLNCNWDKSKGSMLTELIIGGPKTLAEQNGCALQKISNLDRLEALEVFDIRTCYNLESTPDISNLGNLKKFLASDSNITNFLPAKGLILEEVSLPTGIQNIVLDTVTIKEVSEEELDSGITTHFNYTPNTALTHVEILDCEGIDIIDFLNTWYKDLKKYNAMMTNYSCILSFNYLELPPTIDGEDSFVWLNNIRKEFGKNTNGEDNFKIKKGIIKLYGHGMENGEPTGGLTQEDYNELLKYWPEEYFRSDNGVHFDSNKSVFVTVKSNSTRFKLEDPTDENSDSNPYILISGQSLEINTTIFPASSSRNIVIAPNTYNATTRSWLGNWTLSGNEYTNKFGELNTASKISNDNGHIILTTPEYYTGTDKLIRITILDSEDSSFRYQIFVRIVNVIMPSKLKIFDETDTAINVQEITNIAKDYTYKVKFTDNDVNVDIKELKATFGESGLSETENGSLESILDKETQEMTVIYHPLLNKGIADDTSFPIKFNVSMDVNSKNSNYPSEIFQNITFIIHSKDIKNIVLEYNNTPLELDEQDNKYDIEHYIKTPIGNDAQKTFHYIVKFNPEGYNVKIKEMTINKDALLNTLNMDVINIETNEYTNAIESFDIVITGLKQKRSIYESSKIFINLITCDSNDNTISEISQEVDITIGCFYPDEVRLIKTETNNGYTIVDADYLNVDILQTEQKSVNYDLHIYSKIGGILYYWNYTNEMKDDIVSNISDGNFHFLVPNQLPTELTITQLGVTEYSESGTTNMLTAITNGININSGATSTPSFNFLTIGEDNISVDVKVTYSIGFNGQVTNFEKIINISRNPAIASQGNWRSLPIDKENIENNFYYLDRNLRIYTANNIGSIAELKSGKYTIQQMITAVFYIYEDDQANKQILSIDPWLLKDNKTCYWWKQNSTFYTDYVYGKYISSYPKNGLNLLGVGVWGGRTDDNWTTKTNMELFEALYNVYAFVSACGDNTNPGIDGGIFELIDTQTNRQVNVNSNNFTVSGAMELINNGSYRISKKITDNNMIFMIYDYYANNYNMSNIKGRILSDREIDMLYSTEGLVNAFAKAMNVLTAGSSVEFNFKSVLFNDSLGQVNQEYELSNDLMNIISNTNNNLTNLSHSKGYWINSPVTVDGLNMSIMPVTLVGKNSTLNSNNEYLIYTDTSGSVFYSEKFGYCLFTPNF